MDVRDPAERERKRERERERERQVERETDSREAAYSQSSSTLDHITP